ncbi:MAG: hypothetical protein FWB76_00985 [Oscillospiraceae bacterium]|nr:hypothetical protein [Oscillospiraceae bacterium]
MKLIAILLVLLVLAGCGSAAVVDGEHDVETTTEVHTTVEESTATEATTTESATLPVFTPREPNEITLSDTLTLIEVFGEWNNVQEEVWLRDEETSELTLLFERAGYDLHPSVRGVINERFFTVTLFVPDSSGGFPRFIYDIEQRRSIYFDNIVIGENGRIYTYSNDVWDWLDPPVYYFYIDELEDSDEPTLRETGLTVSEWSRLRREQQ